MTAAKDYQRHATQCLRTYSPKSKMRAMGSLRGAGAAVGPSGQNQPNGYEAMIGQKAITDARALMQHLPAYRRARPTWRRVAADYRGCGYCAEHGAVSGRSNAGRNCYRVAAIASVVIQPAAVS